MGYTVGDLVTISTTVRDATGAETAATMAVTVTKPDGTTAATSAVDPANPTATPSVTVTADTAGTWPYIWTASGAVTATEYGQFTVVAPRTLVASLEEFKVHLRRTETVDYAQDTELRGFLAAATDVVEHLLDGPVSVTTYTAERVVSTGGTLVLAHRPVVSVTTATPVTGNTLGTAVDPTLRHLNTTTGVVELYSNNGGVYEVTYTAGREFIPSSVQLAGLIIAQHLWQTRNGGAGLPFPGDDMMTTGIGYAIPRRAAELLRASTTINEVPGFA